MFDPQQAFTGIWHTAHPIEKDWVEEIFRPYISRYVVDDTHQTVLDNAVVFDAFLSANDPAFYARFKGKNAYLVHFLDETYAGPWDVYDNFRGVIRCFWADVFNPSRMMPMPLGYTAGLEVGRPNLKKASERRYVWSFLGEFNKATRPEMAAALVKTAPNFLYATDLIKGYAVFNRLEGGARRRFSKEEFAEFLFDSSFTPSPMGNLHLESFRTYEALECGSIPIVEKVRGFDYYREMLGPHPMPTVGSWIQARRLVQDMIRNPAQMDALQAECTGWWQAYKATYVERLGDFLAQPPDSSQPMVAARARFKGWQIRELVRHHTIKAGARRVELQVKRILKTGTALGTYRPGA